MRSVIGRSIAFLLITAFVCSPVWATCGGGGGGGGGGTSGSGGSGGGSTSNPVVYHVPWKVMKETDKPVTEGLILYWFPASKEELQKSSLKESRELSLYAAQCVAMELADNRTPHAEQLIGGSKLPIAVLANPDGTAVNKVENVAGKLKVADVEKLVSTEVKTRGTSLDNDLKDAKAKAAAGDKDSAIKLYKNVTAQKCMFPKKAKVAQAELKKLGEENLGAILDAPNFDPQVTAAMTAIMKRGLIAENKAQYLLADKLYAQARKMDPADPTPLRYLGELHRHHIGDWEKAKTEFHEILDMPADPLSRAVALHGLGKITIHEGEFKKGLGLMEESVEVYPLALAYRNIAVYWNSENELAKGTEYTQKAFDLDPNDPYNHVFAAVFMAAAGKKDEALKIAVKNENLLPASYNIAAIFAQAGQRDKALAYLKRHFYSYERFHAVREKEMMEARVDAVFDSLRDDQAFLDLTKFADGKLPMRMSPRQAADGAMKMQH
ncbi:MAG TPA: tetratricopeptide repeat protein [Pyrinomonadaceae bacterium]|nr:tetratricopeptide repeat protein [Pyrinomonadaceae bacterium]